MGTDHLQLHQYCYVQSHFKVLPERYFSEEDSGQLLSANGLSNST